MMALFLCKHLERFHYILLIGRNIVTQSVYTIYAQFSIDVKMMMKQRIFISGSSSSKGKKSLHPEFHTT